ncbi:hypothetical protein [Undibacterium sp.]|uniref:hypothetical protein n=1 Tax=Undibacterium sp. TaxID=1914977 RepID=UPI002731198E|nr:hypothetical protein [Undibacterium sp.]MDP1977247.1 hypothetical protein [Undibacterium sp.]
MANGTNNFTSANMAVNVIGGTGKDVPNFSTNQIINFLTIVDACNGTDILNIGSTTTQKFDTTDFFVQLIGTVRPIIAGKLIAQRNGSSGQVSFLIPVCRV